MTMGREEIGALEVKDAICLGCGCVCDDVTWKVESSSIIEATGACDLGREWAGVGIPRPSHESTAAIAGAVVPLDLAIERASKLLLGSQAPSVSGLADSSNGAVRAALSIADRIGASVEIKGFDLPSLRAFQRIGGVSATLGEIRDRADLVVYWFASPEISNPRHLERYSSAPIGRFVPRGRADRRLLCLGDATDSPWWADERIEVDSAARVETLWVLRSLVNGISLDSNQVKRSTGLAIAQLKALAETLKQARYGVFFHDATVGGALEMEALSLLVRDLNADRRFVLLGLGVKGNRHGAASVMTWQTGTSGALDFATGIPRDLPGDGASDRLNCGETDLVLHVGPFNPGSLQIDSKSKRFAMPLTIRIGSGATRIEPPPAVAIECGRLGLETGGSVGRVDGPMLRLRPPLKSNAPDEFSILTAIMNQLVNTQNRPQGASG